jgi:hypothetical protein
VAGLLVEHFRRHVPVAFGEQDPGQPGALPGQTEPGRPQFRLSVMPRLAFEIATAGGVLDGTVGAAVPETVTRWVMLHLTETSYKAEDYLLRV